MCESDAPKIDVGAILLQKEDSNFEKPRTLSSCEQNIIPCKTPQRRNAAQCIIYLRHLDKEASAIYFVVKKFSQDKQISRIIQFCLDGCPDNVDSDDLVSFRKTDELVFEGGIWSGSNTIKLSLHGVVGNVNRRLGQSVNSRLVEFMLTMPILKKQIFSLEKIHTQSGLKFLKLNLLLSSTKFYFCDDRTSQTCQPPT